VGPMRSRLSIAVKSNFATARRASNGSRAFNARPNMVALDVQRYTRIVHQGTVTPGLDRRLHDVLAVCDVVRASEEEAEPVTGLSDPEDAARDLASSGREAIVTCGAHGAFICYQGGRDFEPAVPTEIRDPTGAGDIFFAAYLASRLDDATIATAANFAAGYSSKRLAASDLTHLLER